MKFPKLEQLAEAKTFVASFENEKDEIKSVEKVVRGVEDQMETHFGTNKHRYKEWDVRIDGAGNKVVDWVTQETDKYQSKEAASFIAKALRKAGIPGWTVRVVIRDEFRPGEDMKWHAKVKS